MHTFASQVASLSAALPQLPEPECIQPSGCLCLRRYTRLDCLVAAHKKHGSLQAIQVEWGGQQTGVLFS